MIGDPKGWAARKTRGVAAASVPPRAQAKNYTCGPAALRMVMGQLGLPPVAEQKVERICCTSKRHGTTPANLAAGARQLGMAAFVREQCTLDVVAAALKAGKAVVLDLQASDSPPGGDKGGHYVVAQAAGEGEIRVRDPMNEGKIWGMAEKELEVRWHDVEGDGTPNDHLAVVLSLP